MENGTTFHVCLDIAGSLKRSDKYLDGILAENGRELNGAQVKEFLRNVRDKHGYTAYSGCDNMNAEGRCAGHPCTESNPEVEKLFPILNHQKIHLCPSHIPWHFLNQDHALKIHSQSLERLAERGGLCMQEIVGNIKRLSYREIVTMNPDFALGFIKTLAASRSKNAEQNKLGESA
jgi:hypothetical protein